jgi:hypothetical protein
MLEIQLPLFPPELTPVNNEISFQKKDGQIYYFHGIFPVFFHEEKDLKSFRFITSQFIVSGRVKGVEVSNAFGVSYISVKRNVKLLREEGPEGFYKKVKVRGPHVLTEEVLRRAQRILDKGHNPAEVGRRLDLKADTVRKAIRCGGLRKRDKDKKVTEGQTKSERAVIEVQAQMGIACTRKEERVQAALGELTEAAPIFETNTDVRSAGVLLALPSLLSNGLLKYCDQFFSLPKGYYGLQSLLMTLAFVALLRIKSIEGVRHCEPGELGKVVGLDRIPEVRTLREKIGHLSKYGDPQKWGRQLATLWMEKDPEMAGTLYVDGHVKVYHGKKTKLPKRYVSRQKLCLRGVTDYWVNDAVGRPFFVIPQTINAGLLSTLRENIVPQLLKQVPKQPTPEQLAANQYLFRFSLVFDREGYSPAFFKEMWKKRIACYTYRKYARDKWPESEFEDGEVVFPNGEVSKIKLAERGVYFKGPKVWLREIRKLTETGHQTSLITTDKFHDAAPVAGKMFSRWSQENFFKYMMQHYGIDRLIDYGVEKIDETVKVVNPGYRQIQSKIRSKNSKLARKRAEYGALILESEIEENKVKDYVQKKSDLKEIIESMQKEIEELKIQRKDIDKHINFSQLPEGEQFKTLKKSGKQFIDTIKMIAYRAETAMANILQEYIGKKDEARTLIRQILMTDADIKPDEKQGILKINLHNMTNPRNNQHALRLCKLLNESETVFPGTNMRLIYGLVSNQNLADQEF